MKRSKFHEVLKSKELGKKEKEIKGRKRLDASTKVRDVEIERSGQRQRLQHAISKLKDSKKEQRVLRVPQKDMYKAGQIAKELRAKITITNLQKTKRKKISNKKN